MGRISVINSSDFKSHPSLLLLVASVKGRAFCRKFLELEVNEIGFLCFIVVQIFASLEVKSSYRLKGNGVQFFKLVSSCSLVLMVQTRISSSMVTFVKNSYDR
ncbi:uncharacterized protein LOC130820419 [Amaranthus tricolor]|uniref:uncharacterized protein LOC130820419 n=1 Tax=Amaranthus tricolor TaxID=29722 RepID=UPI00258CB41F|nr:uncharacterized protein LOC130820419 [Amaranthus tricolor]